MTELVCAAGTETVGRVPRKDVCIAGKDGV